MILRTVMRSLIALALLIPAVATAQTPSAPAPAASDQLLKPEQLEAPARNQAIYRYNRRPNSNSSSAS
jgi:hypothetical protein